MKSNSHKIVKGMSAQAIITIVMGVLSLVVFSIMSRLLSKEVFGYYAAMNAVIIIFQSISEAGLGSAVIQKKKCTQEYFSTAFTLSLIISVFLAVILFFSAPILANIVADSTLCTPMRMVSILLTITSLDSVGRGAMMRQLKFFTYGIIQILAYVISSLFGIIMALNGYGLYSLIVSSLSNSTIIIILLYTTQVRIPRLSLHKQHCYEIVSFGGWLTASVIVNQMTMQLDKLVLSKWLSVSLLGSYNRPAGFVNILSDRINSIFDTTLFPILSSIQDEIDRIKQTFVKAVSLLNSLSSILAAIIFFNADLIIQIFFGSNWLELVPVMRIISMGVILLVDGRLMDCYFRSLALVKMNFYLRLACLCVMLASLYIGVQYGIQGTAISVVVANFISISIKMTFLCRRIDVPISTVIGGFIKSLRPIIPLCCIGMPFILFIKQPTILMNIVFATVFAIIIICEFVLMPQMVSGVYSEVVNPYISNIKRILWKKLHLKSQDEFSSKY